MNRVIVSVSRHNEAHQRDLDLPADVPARELAALVVEALRWDTGGNTPIHFHIRAEPSGRILAPQETLHDASVWNGAQLVFQPVSGAVPSVQPALSGPSSPVTGPVNGWTPLGVQLQQNPAADAADSAGSTYAWKKLDD